MMWPFKKKIDHEEEYSKAQNELAANILSELRSCESNTSANIIKTLFNDCDIVFYNVYEDIDFSKDIPEQILERIPEFAETILNDVYSSSLRIEELTKQLYETGFITLNKDLLEYSYNVSIINSSQKIYYLKIILSDWKIKYEYDMNTNITKPFVHAKLRIKMLKKENLQ